MKNNNNSEYSKEYEKNNNKKEKSSGARKVWVVAGIILLLILITLIFLLVRSSSFASYERNSIFLVPVNPGLVVNDDKQAWGTENCIDLFEEVYSGNGKDITVESSNGDKLIAPGTESEYTFNLKNTGNVAMDYNVTIDASLEFDDQELVLKQLPIGVRLRTYSGEYLLGDGKNWVSLAYLEDYSSSGTLSVNNYAWYTLEWKWLYEEYIIDENGKLVGPVGDEWDTVLGNVSAETPISLKVVISTIATPSKDYDAIGGIEQYHSDDGMFIQRSEMGGQLRFWPILLIILLIILIAIVAIMIWREKSKEKESEDDEFEDGESEDSESEDYKFEDYKFEDGESEDGESVDDDGAGNENNADQHNANN